MSTIDRFDCTRVPVFRKNSLTGISQKKVSLIVEGIGEASGLQTGKKRASYAENDKLRIANYANLHTPIRAVKRFQKDFPKLSKIVRKHDTPLV